MTEPTNSQPKKRGRPSGAVKVQPEALQEALGQVVDIVEHICAEKGWSLTELQGKTGLARSTLYNLRKSDPQLSTVYAVAGALGIPPYLLFMNRDDLRHLLWAVADAPEVLGTKVPRPHVAERSLLESLSPAGGDLDAFSIGSLVGQRLHAEREQKGSQPITSLADIATIAEWMQAADNVVVVTGAGMSTEANYLDFRSDKGLQTLFPDFKDLATLATLETHFEKFVAYYRYRIQRLADAVPHSGHHTLARWVKERRIARLITLNADGLHTIDDENPALELQGSIRGLSCVSSCGRGPLSSDRYLTPGGEWCGCGGKLRPMVKLHDEVPWGNIAQNQRLAAEAVRTASLIMVLGSSLTDNAATRQILRARLGGAKLVIVNRTETSLDLVAHAVIQGSVQAFLTRLERALL